MNLPYEGRCPYDNTPINMTFGYSDERWFCQNSHEWSRPEQIYVPDRCEGSFKYGARYNDFYSVCLWCGNKIEHHPFFNREYGERMKFHRLKQPSNFVLELGETFHFSEAKYFGVITTECNGCGNQLASYDLAQLVTDRLNKRQYVIHIGCYTRLVNQLERGV